MKNRTEEVAEKLFITKLLLVAGIVCNGLFKITHFVAIIEETSVERLVRLFRNNM